MSISRSVRRRSALLAAVSLALVGGGMAAAGTATWNGGGGDDNFTNPANWGGTAPAAGDVLEFNGATRPTPNNDFGANTIFNGLNFLGGAAPFTLGGATIQLGGDVLTPSTINNLSSNAQTINLGLLWDGSTTNVNSASGALTLGAVTFGLNAPTTLIAPSATISTLNVNNNISTGAVAVRTHNAGAANTINLASGRTLTVNGAFTMGGYDSFNTSTTPKLTIASFDGLGNVDRTGHLVINAGASNLLLGGNSSGTAGLTATLDLTGLNSFTFSGAEFNLGGRGANNTGNRGNGIITLADAANTITATTLNVGNGSNGNAGGNNQLNLGAGTNVINATTINVGAGKSVGNFRWLAGTTTGTLKIRGTGGTDADRANITVASRSFSGTATAADSMNLNGHAVDILADTITVGQQTNTSTETGSFSFDTGTVNANLIRLGVQTGGSGGAIGTFTMGGGTLAVGAGGVSLTTGASATSSGTFNVNGGTATLGGSITRSGTLGTSAVSLGGGTLNMGANSIGTAAAPLTAINLTSGTLNTSGVVVGTTTTLGASLTIAGTPTWVIPAGGTLNSSLPTFTLATGSTLEGGGATASTVAGNVTAASGSRVTPGTATAAGTLNFSNNLSFDSGSTVRFKLSDVATSGNDIINVAGALSLSGTVNLEFGTLGAGAQIGNEYTLFTYPVGSLTGNETNLVPLASGSRKTFTVLPTVDTPGAIKLLVGGTPAVALTWVGGADNNWQLDGTNNWQNPTPAADKFFNQDTVTFDGTSGDTDAVQVVGQVSPGSIVVNTDTRDYKFAGAGSIAGVTGLTKTGGGLLTVANDNGYSGPTDIQAGTLQIGDGGTTGSLGTSPINNAATLIYNRSNTLTHAGVISGAGALRVDSGTLALSGTNTQTGTINVKNGATLRLASGGAIGAADGGEVTIENGGTLELGMAASFTGPPALTGNRNVRIIGVGVSDGAGGNRGAIYNPGANQLWAFQNLTLDGNATIAGSRMDVGRNTAVARTLTLNGHTLSLNMSGSNPIFSVLGGVSVTAGNILVTGGGFNIEGDASVLNVGGTITFNPGTNFQVFRTTADTITRPMVFKGNNIIGGGSNSGLVPTVNSNMTLEGNMTLQALASGVPGNGNNPLILAGSIGESGGARTVTKVGINTVTLTGANTYSGGTTITGGTIVLSGNGTVGSGPVVNNGTLTVNNNNALGNVSGTGTTAVSDGSVAVTVSANHFRQGTLSLGNSSTAIVNPNSNADGVSVANTVTFGIGSKIDLKDNKLITLNAAGTASEGVYNGLQGQVQTAYNFGSWDGPGLTTSMPDALAGIATVGVATGEQIRGLGPTDTDVWAGQTINGASTIAMYTYAGDANLDGQVDAGDYGILDAFIQIEGATGYGNGDFNYDGFIDAADYGTIDNSIQFQGPPIFTSGGAGGAVAGLSGVTAVPEPTAAMLLIMAPVAALARRRRRRG